MPTAFILILVDTDIMPDPEKAKTDVGIAAQTILLGAASMGLGGCMIGSFDRSVREALSLPENLAPALVVALGTPDEEIILEDKADKVDYYRDENGVHRFNRELCIACGKCSKICPQGIDIPAVMQELTKRLEAMPTWKEICRQRELEQKQSKDI